MKILKAIPPLVVLGGATLIYWGLVANKSEPVKRKPPKQEIAVDVLPLKRTDFPVQIPTRGTVRARTSSTLIPEVPGRIVSISPKFRSGGFFEEGDVLLTIDKQDYETAVTVAAGVLAEATAALEEEKAKSEQALENWKTLGRKGKPSALALREPQLAEARARVAAATAQQTKAKRDLERTEIKAPYRGRVLEQSVDVGQYVTTGTVLAGIYAVDYAEIRLPVSSAQAGFVDLPEQFRGDSDAEVAKLYHPKVLLSASYGGKDVTWEGEIVRTEGAVDDRSRLIFVVAQVDDPYARRNEGAPPLKVGMFVEAEIEGHLLKDVYVIPRKAVRQGNMIVTVDSENKLQRHLVDVIWNDADSVITRTAIPDDERLCITPLAFAPSGTEVSPRSADEGPQAVKTKPEPPARTTDT